MSVLPLAQLTFWTFEEDSSPSVLFGQLPLEKGSSQGSTKRSTSESFCPDQTGCIKATRSLRKSEDISSVQTQYSAQPEAALTRVSGSEKT